MRVLAPAKINLHLRVGPRRGDGFHPLLSWMVTAGLFDTLSFERASSSGLALTCDRADLACGERNIVVRAGTTFAQALAETSEEASANVCGVAAVLRKRIPVGAGLGGGSSDAARTLLALNRLWNAGWSASALADLAAGLGSDLPFFFHGLSSICSGRGEIVRPVEPPKPRWAMLILPAEALATADVYRRFDELGLGADDAARVEPNWKDWARLTSDALLPKLVNDLEPAAFALRPELGRLRQEVEESLLRVVRMSGSGSSLFTLFDGRDQAEAVAHLVTRRHQVPAMAVELAPEFRDDLGQ